MRKRAVEVLPRQSKLLRPVSTTVGRLGDLSRAISEDDSHLNSMVSDGMSEEQARSIADQYQLLNRFDEDNGQEVQVQIGGDRPLRNIWRSLMNPRLKLHQKLYGAMTSPLRSALASFSRADRYDPYSHSIIAHSSLPAVLARNLGVAEDYALSADPMDRLDEVSAKTKNNYDKKEQNAVASAKAIAALRAIGLSGDELRSADKLLAHGLDKQLRQNPKYISRMMRRVNSGGRFMDAVGLTGDDILSQS